MLEERMNGEPRRKTLQIDLAKYQAMLDAPDLDEEKKRQFIEALWQVIVAFVDFGFLVHPVQIACGKVDNAAAQGSVARSDVLDSSHNPTSEFTAAKKAESDRRS